MPSHPLSPLLLLPSIFSSIRVFPNEPTLRTRCPKYQSFSFSISPSNEYPGLTSFRTDHFDLLAVQGTLKSLLQHHSLKASVLWRSAFFMVQLSYLYMTTGKTIALILRTVVGRVMALLFTMLPRFEIAFLSWNKHLLNSPSSVRPNPARSLKSGRPGQTSNDAKWSTAVNAREHRRGSGWPAFPLSSCTRFTVASSSCLLV